MKISIRSLLLVSTVLIGIGVFYGMSRLLIPWWDESVEFIPLDSIQIGEQSIQFYIEYSYDSAVFGFLIPNKDDSASYFPVYGSTYRGLPPVNLEVLASEALDQMWVLSSWKGYENLAYYRIGTDSCITHYGEITSFNKPTPSSLGGGKREFPKMNPGKVSRVAMITYHR